MAQPAGRKPSAYDETILSLTDANHFWHRRASNKQHPSRQPSFTIDDLVDHVRAASGTADIDGDDGDKRSSHNSMSKLSKSGMNARSTTFRQRVLFADDGCR